MALGSNEPRIYLSVADGKIIRNVPEGTPGAVERINKNEKKVWEMKYSFVSGILTGIRIKENEYNGNLMKSWQLSLVDGDDLYSLEIHYDSAWATSMLNAFANPELDFHKPIKFTPWQKDKPDGKKTRCLYINQGDSKESIQWVFTKDEPNGLPPLVETMLKGKRVWDNYDRMQFLEKLVEENIIPRLPSESAAALSAQAIVPPPAEEKEDSPFKDIKNQPSYEKDDDDDLPF